MRLFGAVLLAALLQSELPGTEAPAPMPEFVARIGATLPTGWTATAVGAPGIPAGWQSHDTRAVTLQVSDGRETHTVTAVPLDWMGFRSPGAQDDSVLRGPAAKVIVPHGTARQGWLATLAPAEASLASAQGSTDAFAGQYGRIEEDVRALLRRSRISREAAVASLIALGVPAEDMIRQAALEARNGARLAAIRSLRHFPGKATREVLQRIIADRSRDAAADACRIAALDACAALMIDSHGPAVLAALQVEKDEATARRLIAEINQLRHAPAAPELRRWLGQASSLETKVACARALATLRDTSAAAAIQAAIDAPPPKRAAVAPPVDAAARRQLALELHRLTGSWGPEVRGSRLSVVMESPDQVVVYVENLGAGPMHFIPYVTATGNPWPIGLEITLDGSRISPPGPGAADIGRASDLAREIAAGTTASFELQLPRPLAADTEHTLAATWFDLTAEPLAVRATP